VTYRWKLCEEEVVVGGKEIGGLCEDVVGEWYAVKQVMLYDVLLLYHRLNVV
jgi:hypothetical protein